MPLNKKNKINKVFDTDEGQKNQSSPTPTKTSKQFINNQPPKTTSNDMKEDFNLLRETLQEIMKRVTNVESLVAKQSVLLQQKQENEKNTTIIPQALVFFFFYGTNNLLEKTARAIK